MAELNSGFSIPELLQLEGVSGGGCSSRSVVISAGYQCTQPFHLLCVWISFPHRVVFLEGQSVLCQPPKCQQELLSRPEVLSRVPGSAEQRYSKLSRMYSPY